MCIILAELQGSTSQGATAFPIILGKLFTVNAQASSSIFSPIAAV